MNWSRVNQTMVVYICVSVWKVDKIISNYDFPFMTLFDLLQSKILLDIMSAG